MKIISHLLLSSMIVIINGEFFTYQDCDKECLTQSVSCIIEEVSKTYFSCECLKSSMVCELHAKPTVVCLRPDRPALGGEDIWIDWRDYHNKNVTTTTVEPTSGPTTVLPTTERPAPSVPTKFSLDLIASIGIAITILILGAGYGIRRLHSRITYQRIPSTPTVSNQVQAERSQPFQEMDL